MKKNLLSFVVSLSLLATLLSNSQPFLSESAGVNSEIRVYRNQRSQASLEHDTGSLYLYIPDGGQIQVEPVDDTYTDQYYYLHNYGGSWTISVGKLLGWSLGWLKFNISAVPKNAYNISATLEMNCNDSPSLEPEFMNDAPIVSAHYSSSTSWSEESITYSTQPSYNATALDSERIYRKGGLTGDWFSWNVSKAFAQFSSKGQDLVTIVMKNSKTFWSCNPLDFDSKESGWDHPRLTVRWSGIVYDFPTLVTGTFKEDMDGKWRLYANTTIVNNNEDNITISWFSLNAHNVTYTDGTFQELNAEENRTVNHMLLPGEHFLASWIISESGFNKKPKFAWVTLTVSFFGFENQPALTVAVPLDTSPPSISILNPQNMTYATNEIPLTFTIDESTDWIGYTLDGAANATVGGNSTLNDLLEGPHGLTVYANDTFGNMGASEKTYFHIDTLLPNIVILSPENKTYTTNSISIDFTVDEPTSWTAFSLDGNANQTISSRSGTIDGVPDGSHSIVVYATDDAGNTGVSGELHFSIDTARHAIPLPFLELIIVAAIVTIGAIIGFILYRKRKHP